MGDATELQTKFVLKVGLEPEEKQIHVTPLIGMRPVPEESSVAKYDELNRPTRDGEGFDEEEISLPLILPPDGGWGWAVAAASFFTNMIVDGVCYTFAIIYNELLDHFGAGKGQTALVGALVPGVYLLVGECCSQDKNR